MVKPFRLLHNAVRAKEIVTVFAKYGFRDALQFLDRHAGPFQRLVPQVKEKLSTWERIRRACEELGPTFIKIGQILSARPDLIPEPLIKELKYLQESAKPETWEDIRQVLEEEWGDIPETFFSEINTVPMASASLAQVHEGRLRGSTDVVVIKAQRPNIHQKVEADLEILFWLADQLHQRFEGLKGYDLPAIAREIGEGIRRELDFTNEARNLDRFHRTNGYPEVVGAPKLFDQYTTPRVLVMEKIKGKRPDELDLPTAQSHEIARRGAASLFHQIVISGFFHADPHPGNLRVQDDGKIIFLDWGLAGHLTQSMRYWLADLVQAVIDGDSEMVAHLALRISLHPHRVELRRLEKEIQENVNHFFNLESADCEFGQIILELMHIFSQHNVGLSRDFALVAKSVLSIEEVGKTLDPDFKVTEIASPLVNKLKRERVHPSNTWRWMKLWLGGNLFRLQRLPMEIQRLLGRINDGDISINLRIRSFQELRATIDGASNRLSLAIMLGSIVIGSSMIITTGIRPHLFGYPAIGIIGYTLSGLLGIWTIIGILRHGKHK